MFPPSRRVVLFGNGKNVYLLDDEFTDTLAAGAVNGTPATPGPGTRTVVDSENKLSVSGGNLVLTPQAAAAWNDEYVLYGAVTRTAGQVWLVQFTASAFSNVALGMALDLTWAAPDTDGEAVVDLQAGEVRVRQAGVVENNTIAHSPLVAGTTYQLAMVLRSTGTYYFIKGGVFTNWSLLWPGSTNSAATVYPIIANYASALNVSYLRVPQTLWLPTPLAYDTFTRANGALGSSEAAGPDSQAISPLAWTNQQGTVQISGNTAIATALDVDRAICTVSCTTADLLLSANLTKNTTGAGIVLRYQDSDNYVYMWHNGTNLLFVSRAGGIETTLVNAAAAYGAGRTILGVLSGTSGSSFYNNAKIGATQVVPASALAVHGLIFFDTDSTLDVFRAFPRGTSGEYAALDKWSGTNP